MHPVVQPSVVSLFAGIGGFDLGFARAGCRTVATVEIDKNCRRLLSARWPDAVHLDDVRTAGRHNLPECDVVVGGSPCQSFSVAGLRNGLNDPRGNLLLEYLRVVSELRPAWMVWENVPGVLSDKTKALNNMLDALEELGYIVDVEIIDAQFNGVAQRRRRVFVCGRSVESLATETTSTSALIIAQCLTEILHGILVGTLEASGEGPFGSASPRLSSDGLTRRIRLFRLHGETGSLWQTWRNCLDGMQTKYASVQESSDVARGESQNTFTQEGLSLDAEAERLFTRTAPSWKNSLDAAFDLVKSYTTLTATSSTTPQTIFMCSWAVLHIARLIARLNTSCPPFYAAASSSLTALKEYIGYAQQTSSSLFGDTSGVRNWVDFIRQAEQTSDALGNIGVECFGTLLPLSTSLRGHPAPSREAGKGTTRRSSDGAGVSGTLDRKSCLSNRGSQANEAEVIAIQDVRGVDKAQNGRGHNGDGTAYTVDAMATQGVCVPDVAGTMPSRASGGGGGPGAGTDEAAAGYLIPTVAGTLKSCGGKTGGWSNSADHAAAGYMIPAVAGCLQERDAKGADSDTKPGHLIPVAQVQWASGGGKVLNPTAQALRAGAEINYQFLLTGNAEHDTLLLQPLERKVQHGNATETDARKILRLLREAYGAEAYEQWKAALVATLQPPEVLRQALHGAWMDAGDRDDHDNGGMRENQGQEPSVSGSVRAMRGGERKGRSSQGQGLEQQQTGKPDADLPILPQEDSLEKGRMQGVWQTAEGAWILRQALSAIQEVRQPASDKGQSVCADKDGESGKSETHVPDSWLRASVSCKRILRDARTASEARSQSRNASNEQKREGHQAVEGRSFQVRRLSAREAERLQGFQWRCSPTDHEAWQDELGRWWSPDYTADFSDSVRYRMLGNAVCVNVAEWIAKRMVKEVRRDQA